MLNGQGGYGLECLGAALVNGGDAPPTPSTFTSPSGIISGTSAAHGSAGTYTVTMQRAVDTARTFPWVAIQSASPIAGLSWQYAWLSSTSLLITVGNGTVNVPFFLAIMRAPNP